MDAVFPVLAPLSIAAFLLLLVRLAFSRVSAAKASAPTAPGFPPGPPSIPVLGNVHQLPHEYQERTFANWAKTYGEFPDAYPVLTRRRRTELSFCPLR